MHCTLCTVHFHVLYALQLCAVSKQEIDHKRQATFRARDVLGDMSAPRIFSLQKLVEVADFNMDSRGRIVWADIWGVLSAHFAAIGSHDNTQVTSLLLPPNTS
jgi:brefeldin A-inhibited guanine nucleotide-exchange protein